MTLSPTGPHFLIKKARTVCFKNSSDPMDFSKNAFGRFARDADEGRPLPGESARSIKD